MQRDWLLRQFGWHLRLRFCNPIPRPGARSGGPVARISELTSVQRETPTPYALRKPSLKAFKFGNSVVNALRPGSRQLGPIRAFRNMVARQLGQLRPNFLQGQPDLLGEHNECDTAENCTGIAPMPSLTAQT